MADAQQSYPVDVFTLAPLVRDPDNHHHGIPVDDEAEKDPDVPKCVGQLFTSFLQEWQIVGKMLRDLSYELHLMKGHSSSQGDMILLVCIIAAFDRISEIIRPMFMEFHRQHFACFENQREAFDLPGVVTTYCDAWAMRTLLGNFVEPITKTILDQMKASPHSGNATRAATVLLAGKMTLFGATCKDCYIRTRAISSLMGNGMELAEHWPQLELSVTYMTALLKTLMPDFKHSVQEAMRDSKKEYIEELEAQKLGAGDIASAQGVPETIHEEEEVGEEPS